MFKITNTKKGGELSFYNAARRPVLLNPGQVKEFPAELLSAGILRPMIGKGSLYKVEALTERATAMLDLASKPREGKPKGFAMVHGRGDISRAASLEAEHGVRVRDLKSPVARRKPGPEAPEAPEGTGEPLTGGAPEAAGTFIREEAQPDLPPVAPTPPAAPGPEAPNPSPEGPGPAPEPVRPAPEAPRAAVPGDTGARPTPASDRIARKVAAQALHAKADDLPFADLAREASAILGDDYPKGTAGRKSLKTALAAVQ